MSGDTQVGPDSARLIVVDDDPAIAALERELLETEGFAVDTASTGREALQRHQARSYSLALVDLRLPDMSGLALLDRLRQQMPVIIITGHGDVSSAVEAMKQGAHDYLTKPIDALKLLEVVLAALQTRPESDCEPATADPAGWEELLCSTLGGARSMRQVYAKLRKVAPSLDNVLILGETGVGKQVLCEQVHALSPRRGLPFRVVSCADTPSGVLAQALFGCEAGAYPGAMEDVEGAIEAAAGGTLALLALGGMAPRVQAALLDVLHEGEARRVGTGSTYPVDVRFVTTAVSGEDDASGLHGVREDLAYRLSKSLLAVPPLRERPEDIVPLASRLLSRRPGAPDPSRDGPRRLSPESIDLLVRHRWPGNLQELESVLERAVALSSDAEIQAEDIARSLQASAEERPTSMDQVVKDHVRQVLRLAGGNKSKAAKMLGISRSSLYRKLKE